MSSLRKAHFDALEHALRAIEAAGEALVAAPRSSFDLRPPARSLERAATRLLDAYDGRSEVGGALEEATASCDDAARSIEKASATDIGLRPASEWVKKASGWLRNAFETASRVSTSPPVTGAVFASRDVPSLHALVRSTFTPSYSVVAPLDSSGAPDPLPDPSLPLRERMELVRKRADERRAAAAERRASAAEKRDLAKLARDKDQDPAVPGFVAGRYRSVLDADLVRERARDCFEEIAALGSMRIPLLGDPWRTSAVFDARMMTAIDALAALGPRAMSHLERFVVDAPAKDPSRAFAVALIGGSFDGRDSLAVVERALRFLGVENPATSRSAAEGLALAPHPGIPDLLRRWLTDSQAALRALAIDVLARRGEVTALELEQALRDEDPIVIEKALIPAAIAKVPDLAIRAEDLLTHTHEGMAEALAWALVMGEVRFAMTHLTEWLGSSREEAALIPMVMAGDKDDVKRVLDLATERPKRHRLVALGWSGSADAIPLLVKVLGEAKDDELKLSAAFALDRMTGARLYEDTLVPPENLDIPEPDAPPDPGGALPIPLARRVGDARDLPAEGSADRMQLPTTDRAKWEQWLAAHPDKFVAEKRYRRGHLYTPSVSLQELDREPLVPHERRLLFRELILKTGHALPFDPHGFLATQEAQLDAWAEPASRGSSQPGVFGRVRRR